MSHNNSLTRLELDADDYNTAYTHPLLFRLLYFVAQTPQSELLWETFTEGGFEIEPTTDPEAADPLRRTAIKYRLLLDNSLDVEEVARILDTGVEGVRRRLADRTLYGIPTEDGLKIPSFQFANGELLPGLEHVMPLLHDDLHPIAVQNWFTSPNTDLLIRDEQVSPRQWLLSGRNPDDLARIAIDVQLPKLPPPPRVRELREHHPPEVAVLSAGTELWRLHFRSGDHPSEWNEFRRFGPVSTARFDHHTRPKREQNRAILYAATLEETCIAEAFQEARLIDRWRRAPWLAGFALRSEVRLLDLTGLWPTRAGASTAISSSESRWRTQQWSRNIYWAYRDVAGILYGSSMHGNDPAIALYERAQPALDESPFFHQPLAHPVLLALLKNAATTLRYDLV